MTDVLEADACVVGAGPSGAVTCQRLSEDGLRVICLEQGDWPDYGRARAAHPDFELAAARDWAWSPNVRASAADYPVDESESDIGPLMFNGVGGGTVLYAAHWQRNLPSDFRTRTLDGVGDDWPIGYPDLLPYYERVERDFAVSGLAGDPAFRGTMSPPLPPAPLGRLGERIAAAHDRLGWHWWPGSNAIATVRYRALNPCVQRAACMWGCVDGAKASVDRTHWPGNLARGVQLLTGARAARIVVGRRGLVDGVVFIDREGVERRIRSGVTILCANAIGTPRLLLLSADGRCPDGLANSSGLVGRRLMLHPFGAVVGLFDEDLQSWQGVWGQHLYSLQFYETDMTRGFVRGAKWGLMPTGGPLGTTRAYPWGDQRGLWGERFTSELRRRLGHSALWGVIAEDLPDEANRVVVHETLRDSDGLPAPKIVYRTSENSRALLQFHLARARESLLEAGAYETIVAPQIRDTGWHLLGTARMGTDPATSVVDQWGRCHDVANLFIFDGSVWPTSSGMNPTATIAALALRCAERLVQERRNQVVAA